VIWICGVIAYDPWLRPWDRIIAFCAFMTLGAMLVLLLLFLRCRFWAGVAAFLFLALAVPTPSFVRSTTIENRTDGDLEARFSSLDGQRTRQALVGPGRTWRFTYYSGDASSTSVLPVALDIRNAATDSLIIRTQLNLPLGHAGPGLVVSNNALSITRAR
jgi:hypothetical protein